MVSGDGLPDWAWWTIGIGIALVVGGVIWIIVAFCLDFFSLKGSSKRRRNFKLAEAQYPEAGNLIASL